MILFLKLEQDHIEITEQKYLDFDIRKTFLL